MGENAFGSCHQLETVRISDLEAWCQIDFADAGANPTSLSGNLYNNYTELTNLVIPDGVKAVGNYTFLNLPNLKSVTLPNSVEYIGKKAFWGCHDMTTINIPDNVTTIQEEAFNGCTRLYNLTIGKGLKTIGEEAFYNCSSIYEIDLPQGLTSIGSGAFWKCTKLQSIDIPSVTSIGAGAFRDCTSLTKVSLSDDLVNIPNYAFDGCTALSNIVIPAKVETIGDMAYSDCNNIESVSVLATAPPTAPNNVFPKYNIPLIVPDGYQATYQSVTPWNRFESFGALCQKPTITLENGKLHFSCETDDVEYHYSISNANSNEGTGNDITFSQVFTVSVYATKEGCENSATAVLEIAPSNSLKGDVNQDGVVTITDAVSVVNIILSSGTE